MDQQMDQWTDGWRDKPSYKDARTPLKKENMQPFPFKLSLYIFLSFFSFILFSFLRCGAPLGAGPEA